MKGRCGRMCKGKKGLLWRDGSGIERDRGLDLSFGQRYRREVQGRARRMCRDEGGCGDRPE
jgi:hypothetical protein